VAVRFPAHPAAQELIRRSTGAVAAPSANRFGMLSPTRAEHVAEQLGDRVDIILDGGPAAVGVESTVLDLSGPGVPRILRPGGLSRQRLEALLGPLAAPGEAPAGSSGSGETRASPGLLKSHYAPHTPLVLHSPQEMAAMPCDGGLGYLFFTSASHDRWRALQTPLGASDITVRESGVMQNVEILSEKGDTLEAAAKLFDCLHRLDKQGLRYIHAEAAPPEALGEAINDRLTRAAATG
jgi:L-threonylcarbamoyladenylate synthase